MTERYRIVDDAFVYFVTYSIVDWLPVFVSGDACQIVTESLNYCHRHKGLRVNAYVIMPSHLHAIVFHEAFDNDRLENSLADFRKYTGRALCDYCASHLPRCFAEAMIQSAVEDRSRRCWQPSRHQEGIQRRRFWNQKFHYIHENPCRKGLVSQSDHWRFSSARYYASDGCEACDVKISVLEWP